MAPAAVLRGDGAVVVRLWKHQASLNTTAEIQATDYVDWVRTITGEVVICCQMLNSL